MIIYTAQDQVYAEPILREFEKETGIKVKAVYDSEAVKTIGSRIGCSPSAIIRSATCSGATRDARSPTRRANVSRKTILGRLRLSQPPHRHQHQQTLTADAPKSLLELTNKIWRGKVALAFPAIRHDGRTSTR